MSKQELLNRLEALANDTENDNPFVAGVLLSLKVAVHLGQEELLYHTVMEMFSKAMLQVANRELKIREN